MTLIQGWPDRQSGPGFITKRDHCRAPSSGVLRSISFRAASSMLHPSAVGDGDDTLSPSALPSPSSRRLYEQCPSSVSAVPYCNLNSKKKAWCGQSRATGRFATLSQLSISGLVGVTGITERERRKVIFVELESHLNKSKLVPVVLAR
jgi:hypothetical protein